MIDINTGVHMRDIRYIPLYLALAVIIIMTSGCGDMQRHELMMKDMQTNIAELKKAQSEDNVRIEELSNRVFLLQERLNSINKDLHHVAKDVDDLKEMAIPVKPPEELNIVKITPEAAIKEEPKKAEPVKEVKEEPKKTEQVKAEQTKEMMGKVPEPETLYREAQDFYTAGKLNEAIAGFRKFIRYYPKDHLADNAQYWIGEVYYTNKEFAKAIVEFKKVVDNYPDENKAPDALLKIGLSYMEMGDRNRAAEFFKKLIEKYPKSDAAEKAKLKLKDK
ncbi:MAG: tol-pal system protein YbgF [Deltaproteobacteria bacterium GWC2_42_11]|nr:MAG: tol-pal system protein YbgF [Deltaproteobacteria bacterium GWC2_42_11]HBO84080.1 tol-pal system protein YbgF [Deltaproteobacteria bacterium]